MKKQLLLAIVMIAAMSITTLDAQVKVGLKLGADFSNLQTTIMDKSVNDTFNFKRITAPRLGFFVEIPLNENLFIHTGVFASIKGYKWESIRVIDQDVFDSEEKEVILAIDYPIQLGYKYDLDGAKLFAMVGPVISFNQYATNLFKADGKWSNDHQSIGNDEIIDTFKPMDFGLNIEGGIEVNRFMFSVFYTQGLANISSFTTDYSVKSNVIGIAAAIKFGSVDDGRRRGGHRRR